MFRSKGPTLPPETDFTKNLREASFYRYGHLRSFGLTGEVTALAVDPILSLFAVGTSSGQVHCYGSPAFQFTLPISGPSSSSAASSIKFLYFHPGHHRLVAVDSGNTLHSFSLQQMTDHPSPLTHPPLPTKEASYTLWGTIMAVEAPLPSHTHLFIALKDGTTLCWDLSRGLLGSWKVGNCWMEYEEKLVRSGIPGRRKTLGGPMATCLATNPRDLNIMLIGYEGGVVAWNMQQGMVEKTFEMTLPPGAPGGGSYQDADGSLWTERTPSVTSISWRPDGLAFCVGHQDGCLTFWAYSESDKPLMVRTLTHEDVNVTDAESLLSAGALDNQIRSRNRDFEGNVIVEGAPSAVSANREPIFKLVWAGFPDQASLQALMKAQGTEAAGEPLTNATMDYAERGETLLVVLGGQSPSERPGINVLQFPAYQPPPLAKGKNPQSPSESMSLQDRYAFRDSLMPTGSSNYPTRTPPEDFCPLPRSSPYFSLAHDPIALVVSLTPDTRYTTPSARSGVEAWAFPPPRSNAPPPSPGRKNFVQPGEGEKLVAMTPAPTLSPVPGTPRMGNVSPGWRLPWSRGSSPGPQSPGLQSPGGRIPTPDSMTSYVGAGRAKTNSRRKLALPSSLWSGNLAVLGCELVSLPTPNFKRLISWSIEHGSAERLPIRGGMAVPDLQSHGAPDVKVAKLENYRVLITFHPDATIRFWDVSPQLLLLPTPLRFEYPGPLPHLTISIAEYLRHPDVAHLPLAKLWETDRSKVVITSVHLAREALECTITLQSGEVIVTKFGEAKKGHLDGDAVETLYDGEEGDEPKSQEYFPDMGGEKSEWVEEVTEIGHLARWGADGFKPVAIFTVKRGEAVKCAVSDIGFIAVAFASKSLAIMDMRGPDVMLREGFDEDGVMMKKKKKKGNVQNVLGENSVVGAMKWVVSGMGADATPRPRLIVSYAKGMTKIYTLVNVLGEWMVEPKPPTFTNDSLSGPLASFVLDPLTGNELTPTAEALQAAMRAQSSPESKKGDTPPHCLWIAASKRSIRCAVNFNGERVAKVELNEDLAEVVYVTRHGQRIIVAITETGTAMFYTVPFLEYITRMDLYYGHQGSRKLGRISIDDRSGDFVEYTSPLDINLRTIFHFRRPYPPRLDPCSVKRAVPPQPLPLSYTWGSWIWGAGPLTGAQLDALVAGPNRPPPPKAPPAPRKPLITWGDPPKEVEKPVATPATTLPKRTAVAKQKAPTRDAREREDVYSEMTNAASMRGNYLDDLGESLNNMSVSASNYVSQAKTAAMKEAAKSTAKGFLGKLM